MSSIPLDRYLYDDKRTLRLKNNRGLAPGVWTTMPTLGAGLRGALYRTEGGAGAADTWGMVLKGSDDTYAAVVIASGDSPVMVDVSDDAATAINAALLAVAAARGSQEGGGEVVLPRGTLEITDSIVMQNHTTLRGQGVGTVLMAAENLGGPVITNAADHNRFITVIDLRIHGNKANQSSATDCDGIVFALDDVDNDEYSDTYWNLRNLVITDCAEDGISITGRGEGYAGNVVIRDCDGIGFHIDAPDCAFHNVRVSGSGEQGFHIVEGNNTFTNCKAFYNGLVTAASGHGFHIEGGIHNTLVACESQDNNAHGFYAEGSDFTSFQGCIADSNNAGHDEAADQDGAGYCIDGSSFCQIVGQARSRDANTREQAYALSMQNGVESLFARIASEGNDAHIENGWHTNIDVAINSSGGGVQEISYASEITPNPTLGNYVIVGALTGNITVNAPAAGNSCTGMEMTLAFSQDGNGSRTVSFDGGSDWGYVASFTLGTTASRRGTVTFRYEGEHWVQIASAADLTVPS